MNINLTKEAKDFFSEYYETLLKEIKETNKWKDILYPCIGRFTIDKMFILPKTAYSFNVIPIKSQ